MFLKKLNFFLASTLIFSVCLGTGAKAVVTDDEYYRVLDVDAVKQEKSNWCWAATAKCISDYLGGEGLSQKQIVKSVKGKVVNEGASNSEQKEALINDGIDTTYKNNPISFSKLKKEIDNDRPILAHIDWSSSSNDHAVVIDGYSINTDDEDIDYIYYMDPAKEADTWNFVEYDEFVDNDDFAWERTYYKNEAE